MVDAKDIMDLALAFHGHKCPAMPLGLRAGLAAMRTLGVTRSRDKELHVVAETGRAHATACFLDGVMIATGCTYGKSNIEKLYHDKLAFTLIDVPGKRAVRVRVRPEYFDRMLQSPFILERKKGIPPQDVPPEITDPLVESVLSAPEETILDISDVKAYELQREPGVFEAHRCSQCGEVTFARGLRLRDGKLVCIRCSGYRG